MAGRIVIEQLEFQGHCGVTPEERQTPQPIAVDVELEYQTETAAATDNIAYTVDYVRVAERIVEVGTSQEACLLETLTERLLGVLFAEFPAERIRIWVRKLVPPLKLSTESVGIRLERSRTAQQLHAADPPPARFLAQQLHRLPKGKALDVAAGRGRNALFLASLGFQVEAIDRDEEALAALVATARQRNLRNLTVRTVDLEKDDRTPEFPKGEYDVIVVFFYLYRSLFPALLDALKPNGVLVYETFLIDNYLRHRHPRHREFCLAHNELLHLTSSLRVLHYDEGEHEGGHGAGAAFTAQLIAQKTGKGAHEPH